MCLLEDGFPFIICWPGDYLLKSTVTDRGALHRWLLLKTHMGRLVPCIPISGQPWKISLVESHSVNKHLGIYTISDPGIYFFLQRQKCFYWKNEFIEGGNRTIRYSWAKSHYKHAIRRWKEILNIWGAINTKNWLIHLILVSVGFNSEHLLLICVEAGV